MKKMILFGSGLSLTNCLIIRIEIEYPALMKANHLAVKKEK